MPAPDPAGDPAPDALQQHLAAFLTVSRALAAPLDLNRLLHRIVEAARGLTSAESSTIMLFEPTTRDLRVEATTRRTGPSLLGFNVPLDRGVAGWVATHAEPVLINDLASDPRWDPQSGQLAGPSARAMVCVPLLARDDCLGALEVVSRANGEFAPEDQVALQWLAAHSAVAIVNARMFIQTDLVAELVHELRTPLTALMATSQLLLHPNVTELQRRDLAETLMREATRLSEMTTGFLDMARLEAGRATFALDEVHAASLLAEAIEVVRSEAAEHDIVIVSDIAPDLPALETDRAHVKQVLLNLLTNAIKYNRPAGVIRVRAEAVPGGIEFSVADTGYGIPAASLTRIFERFYRVPDSEGYAQGTGLGLPIARRIVESLGGDIGVDTLENVGTRFHFRLPLKPKRTGLLGV